MEKLRKFEISDIVDQIDSKGLENYSYLKFKYLVTDTEITLPGFDKIASIDNIATQRIKESIFFLHFETDDQYLYHLKKIIHHGGKFLIQRNYEKHNYVHANKFCKMALLDTVSCEGISHYKETVHGNICQALEQTKHLNGDYVEIGVYRGGSALTAFNYMKYADINRKAHLLDTFDGFDYEEAAQSSETHWEVNNNDHKLFGVQATMMHVHDILTNQCPDQDFALIETNICSEPLPPSIQSIAVANVDVDLYDATRDALQKVAKKVVKGGIIIAEDPTSTPALIGAFCAMEEFLQTPEGRKFMKLHLVGQYFLIKMHE